MPFQHGRRSESLRQLNDQFDVIESIVLRPQRSSDSHPHYRVLQHFGVQAGSDSQHIDVVASTLQYVRTRWRRDPAGKPERMKTNCDSRPPSSDYRRTTSVSSSYDIGRIVRSRKSRTF